MKIFWIIAAHVVAIALLLWGGVSFNDVIVNSQSRYPGVVSVFSVAFGLYTAALNLLYHRSLAFHLFVNRLRLRLARTHTYWQPHVTMTLDATTPDRTPLLDEIWQMLSGGTHGAPKRREATPTTLSVALDDLYVVRFRLDDHRLYMDFEQKWLVPSHLYDRFRQRLANLVESIGRLAKPNAVQCGLLVSFEKEEKNPYYGLFVNRVQPDLLQSFQVTFRLDAHSTCRVEAGKNHVNIESQNLADFFEALRTVVSLKALPAEGST
ncbi:MAG TPA: hypothetical protein VFM25_10925 [Verrucomicrobiae bacterium]|nr:hypothetical protein [Verrucomicrobiae bacterium]